MAFRLALALGGMTVAELLTRISGRELSEWEAYYSLEPFGQVRGDLQAGIVASTVANLFRTKKGDKVYKPGDFTLEFKPPRQKKPKPTPEQVQENLAFVKTMVAAGYGSITTAKERSNGPG